MTGAGRPPQRCLLTKRPSFPPTTASSERHIGPLFSRWPELVVGVRACRLVVLYGSTSIPSSASSCWRGLAPRAFRTSEPFWNRAIKGIDCTS